MGTAPGLQARVFPAEVESDTPVVYSPSVTPRAAALVPPPKVEAMAVVVIPPTSAGPSGSWSRGRNSMRNWDFNIFHRDNGNGDGLWHEGDDYGFA